MDTIITIQPGQIKPLASFLKDQQARIKQAIAALEEEYEANQQTLLQLGHTDLLIEDFITISEGISEPELSSVRVTPSREINGYNTSGSYWDKLSYILKKEDRALTAKQLLELLFEYEPELRQVNSAKRKLIEVNVFSTLTNKAKQNHIGRVRIDNEFRYGFTQWFSKDGQLKKQYYMA